jgi:hypothetical protein
MLEVFLWCDAYTIQAIGASPSRRDGAAFFQAGEAAEGSAANEELNLFVCDENGNTHLRHETLYVAVQALCYALCFYGGDLWLSLLSADNLGPVRIRRVLLSALCPLRFCAPAVRSEFISLVGRCESVSATANGGEGCGLTALDLHEADASASHTNFSGSGSRTGLIGSTGVKLESFFPFDPCLLTTVHAFIAQYYQEWSDVSADGHDTKFTDAPASSELWQQVEESLGAGGAAAAGGHMSARHWSISTASECSESVMSSYDSSMLSALITTYQEVLTSGQQLEPSAEAKLLRAVVARPAHSEAPPSSSAVPPSASLAASSATTTPVSTSKAPVSSTSRRRLRARLGEENEAVGTPVPSAIGPHGQLGLGAPPPSQAEIDQMYARLIGVQTGPAGMARQDWAADHSRAAGAPRGLAFAGSKSSNNLALAGSSTFGLLGGSGPTSNKPPIVNAGANSLVPQGGSFTPLFGGYPLPPSTSSPAPASPSPSASAALGLGLKDFQKRAREYSVGSVGSW